MGYLWEAAGQVLTTDFWTRLLTRPWEAVIQHPRLALEAGVVAGAATAAVAGAIVAAPVVATGISGLFGAAKVAAPIVGFAARHPILTYAALANIELPTEIVRAFGARAAPPAQIAVPAPPTTRQTIVQPARGPFIQQGQEWQAMFGW